MDKYIERLFKEWKTHGKIIIGVDFDNTISPYHTFDNLEEIQEVITLLKECKFVGCYIVIHTACNENRYDEIIQYCNKIGLEIDSINITPIDLPYGKKGSKPYCNHFLDDRAGLKEAIFILKEAMYLQRSYNYSKVKRDEIG